MPFTCKHPQLVLYLSFWLAVRGGMICVIYFGIVDVLHACALTAGPCLKEAAETVRAAVATLLSQLTKQPLHGPRIVLLLNRLLPPGLVTAIEVTLCNGSVSVHLAYGKLLYNEVKMFELGHFLSPT